MHSIFLQYFIFKLEAHVIKSQFNAYFRYIKLFQNHIYEYLKSVMKSYSDELYYLLTSIFLIDFCLSFCKCFLEDTLLNRKRSFISNESLCDFVVTFKISPNKQTKKTNKKTPPNSKANATIVMMIAIVTIIIMQFVKHWVTYDVACINTLSLKLHQDPLKDFNSPHCAGQAKEGKDRLKDFPRVMTIFTTGK